ncbi:P-loop containing nucleoside triphosphate hydrolase protein [Fimicolochytrium jonesii]|uniref:P-loop containing nucleoside triphosphate hydrolase protein n=1 Tax=Fimicolochytrium jonesii TaxID=1396493 RepID=UPI0022FE33BD|nr:P-loop containing nucleoside triphosphate hydrolase protein [Fimicolochytrium jonesii]KAI8825578.1 P-loop containing nucleoside triphosphate hydrolase protein [Fimicolochytrium jonesii]
MTFCGTSQSGLTVFDQRSSVQDFSPCFLNGILYLIPDLILTILALLRLHFLWCRPTSPATQKLQHIWHRALNRILSIATAASALASLLIALTTPEYVEQYGSATVLQGTLHLIALISASTLLWVEHTRTFRPSTLLLVYWPLAAVLASIRVRSLTSAHIALLPTSALITTAIELGMLIAQFVLENLTRAVDEETLTPQSPTPTGSNVNVFSRVTFQYMHSVMKTGKKRTLQMSDLWTPAPKQTSGSLVTKLRKAWVAEGQRAATAGQDAKPSLLRAAYNAFGTLWVLAGVQRFAAMVFAYLQSILLGQILSVISDATTPLWLGILLALLIFTAGVLNSILNVQAWVNAFLTGYKLRAAVNAFIYHKSIHLSPAARQRTSAGQLSNHMGMDTGRVMNFMQLSHLFWAAPLNVAIGTYLLWQQLGTATLAGLGVIVLLLVPMQAGMGRLYERLFARKMKHADTRVNLVDEALTHIRSLKYYGWIAPFFTRIEHARRNELLALRSMALYAAAELFLGTMTPLLVTLASFATAVALGTPLDATRIFVSISLFAVIAEPVQDLNAFFTNGNGARVSLTRLEAYMLLDELDPNAVQRVASDAQPGGSAVVFDNASFAWDEDVPTPTLTNLTLAIPRRALTALVGPLGAGKSSLLAAILGEMLPVPPSSRVHILDGLTIAHVPQQPWIQNATLRENILFGRDYDETWYTAVVDACALRSDIAGMAAGDDTEIGEQGVNLSGGQKQRISLARAVYAAASLYLLDDPLSAVDAQVARHIWDHVIGPRGLLKEKTRVVVTHWLKGIAEVDWVVVVKGGAVVEQGGYVELVRGETEFGRILESAGMMSGDDGGEGSQREDPGEDFASVSTSGTVNAKSGGDVEVVHLIPDKDVGNDTPRKDGKLIQTESRSTGAVKSSHYLTYIRASGTAWLLSGLLVASLAQAALISSTVILSKWADTLDGDNTYLGYYAASVAAAGVVVFAAYALLYAKTGIEGGRVLHARMLRAVMDAPASWFDTTPVGRINNRFSQDMGTIDESLVQTYVQFLYAALSVVSTLIIIVVTNPVFLTFIGPLAGAYYLLQSYYLASSRELKRLMMIASSPVYAAASTVLPAASTIRVHGRHQAFSSRYQTLLDVNQSAFLTFLCGNKWVQIRSELLAACVVLGSCVFAVVMRERVSVGGAGLTITYAMQITGALMMLLRLFGDLQNQAVAVERVAEYTDLPTERERRAGDTGAGFEVVEDATAGSVTPDDWPTAGQISFDDVSMRYRPCMPLVLSHVSFITTPGEKIGIVGRTGAGKSSLAAALFGLTPLDSGRILVDAIDTRSVDLQCIRSRFTLIPQDPALFAGSVRFNLDPTGTSGDAELWAALRAVGMHHRFSTSPELDTPITATPFSVGEKQLLCLSRALLRRSRVIVLDEATAGMDAETDAMIQAVIRSEFRDATVLTIAHRVGTIMDYDRVMVLQGGLVQELGAPADLVREPRPVAEGGVTFRALVGRGEGGVQGVGGVQGM